MNSGLPSECSLNVRVLCANRGQTQSEKASCSVSTPYLRPVANSTPIVDSLGCLSWIYILVLICQSLLWRQCVQGILAVGNTFSSCPPFVLLAPTLRIYLHQHFNKTNIHYSSQLCDNPLILKPYTLIWLLCHLLYIFPMLEQNNFVVLLV